MCRAQPEALTEVAPLVEGGLVPTRKKDRGHQSQGKISSRQSVQNVPFKNFNKNPISRFNLHFFPIYFRLQLNNVMVDPIFDYQFRVILIGDSAVGKSSLLRKFTFGSFAEVRPANLSQITTTPKWQMHDIFDFCFRFPTPQLGSISLPG